MSIITREVNSIAIGQRAEDGYINLTRMAKAEGKLIADYLRLDSTKAFLEALSSAMGIPIALLTETKVGGDLRQGTQGTWAHPQIAINCAQWCSPQFAVLVSKWVFDWMAQANQAPQLQPTPEPAALCPPRASEIVAALKALGIVPAHLPNAVCQIRALLNLPPEQQVEVWQELLAASDRSPADSTANDSLAEAKAIVDDCQQSLKYAKAALSIPGGYGALHHLAAAYTRLGELYGAPERINQLFAPKEVSA